MKTFLLILFTLILFSFSVPYIETLIPSWYTSFDPKGYILHYFAGMCIMIACYNLYNYYHPESWYFPANILSSFAITLTVALAKEYLVDAVMHGDMDLMDFISTEFGSVFAMYVIFFNEVVRKPKENKYERN